MSKSILIFFDMNKKLVKELMRRWLNREMSITIVRNGTGPETKFPESSISSPTMEPKLMACGMLKVGSPPI